MAPLQSDQTVLGTIRAGADVGAALSWSTHASVFFIAGRPRRLSYIRALDEAGCIRWRFLEQRDWMRRLSTDKLDSAFEAFVVRMDASLSESQRLDAQIRRHVRKDDSYLYGKIVPTEADPAATPTDADSVAEPPAAEKSTLRSRPPESSNVTDEDQKKKKPKRRRPKTAAEPPKEAQPALRETRARKAH